MKLFRAHPIPIVARLDYGLALTYSFPRELLSDLLAPGLELDTFGDNGFLSVVSVHTCELRPAFLPKVFGRTFSSTSYRLFTRFATSSGEVLRGLQILRSDSDLDWLVTWGNRLTRYRYRRAHFDYKKHDGLLSLDVTTPNAEADLKFTADTLGTVVSPPEGSPFPDIETSRQFAAPLRLTFDYDPNSNSIFVIEGRRTNWHPQPVPVQIERNTFLQSPSFGGFKPLLANAFYLKDIRYRWEHRRQEQLPEKLIDP
jgi:hypothetical protein